MQHNKTQTERGYTKMCKIIEIWRFLWEFVFMSDIQTKKVTKHFYSKGLNWGLNLKISPCLSSLTWAWCFRVRGGDIENIKLPLYSFRLITLLVTSGFWKFHKNASSKSTPTSIEVKEILWAFRRRSLVIAPEVKEQAIVCHFLCVLSNVFLICS